MPDDDPTLSHGIRRRRQQGCRCDVCQAAHEAYKARARQRNAGQDVPDPRLARRQHGTAAMYDRARCRCELCRMYNLNKLRRWRGQPEQQLPTGTRVTTS